MSRKRLDELEDKIDTEIDRLDKDDDKIFWFAITALLVGLIALLVAVAAFAYADYTMYATRGIAQGEWQCTPDGWKEINKIDSYYAVVHTCSFENLADFDKKAVELCKKSLDDIFAKKEEMGPIPERPEPRRVCIKEQLVRDTWKLETR